MKTPSLVRSLAALIALVSPFSLFAAPGDLDDSFGSGGIVTTDFGPSYDRADDLAIQADGRIVVAGSSWDGTNYNFALARYDTNGSLDATFGTGGKVVGPVGIAHGVALQSDGKIVAAGEASGFAVVRYNPDGSLDTSFGTGGQVITPNGAGRELIIQTDGKIVIAGQSYDGSTGFGVVRYHSNGNLDTGFGLGGVVTTSFGGTSADAKGLALQMDGKIVVMGDSQVPNNVDFALARYNADGSLDASFGSGGKVTTDISNRTDHDQDFGNGVLVQPDGKLLIVGSSIMSGTGWDVALVRYNTDGSLDSTFGGGGKITTALAWNAEYGNDVTLQADGKIVVCGSTDVYTGGYIDGFGTYRYHANGSLDTGFGNGGRVLTHIGSSLETAMGITLQSDGRIVAAGYVYTDSSFTNRVFAMARYSGGQPEIAVEHPPGTGLSDNVGALDLGDVTTGAGSLTKTITLKNTGDADLTGLAVTKDGAHDDDFTVNTVGMTVTLAPGGSTTFTVTFDPSTDGARTAALHIASNDADENPFDINLTGTGTAPGWNDDFGNRIVLGNPGTVDMTGDNITATLELGEINPGDMGGTSVWYQWTAPATGWVTIHTAAGSPANGLDTVLALYSGNGTGGLGALQMMGYNDQSIRAESNGYGTPDDYLHGFGPSRLVFSATAGTVYQIAVHGYGDGSSAEEGPFELHIAPVAAPALRVTALSASPGSVDVTSAAQNWTEQVTLESAAPLDLGDGTTGGADAISVYHARPDVFSTAWTNFILTINQRTGGTATNGTYAAPFTMPRHSMPGFWALGAYGELGGVRFEWSPSRHDVIEDHYLIPPPVLGTLTVINTGTVDTEGPGLAAFNVSRLTVNNSADDQIVRLTMTLTDNESGVDHWVSGVTLSNADRSEWHSDNLAYAQLVSGTPKNGVYELDFIVPSFLPPGTYYWDLHLMDAAGNFSLVSAHPNSATINPLLAAKTLTISHEPVAEISVAMAPATPLADGIGSASLGTLTVGGSGTPVTFTITNNGTASLTGLAVTKDGAHGGDFTVNTTGMAATLAAGGSTSFTVTFAPTAADARTAALHIASNDADENPFDINLTGTGQAPGGGATISEVLDTPSLTWSHNFPSRSFFTGQTAVSHDGADAVRTPAGLTAPSGGANWQQLFTQVTGPGTLTFWWKKTGDSGQSQLDFDWSEVAGFVYHPHASRTDTFDWVQETVNVTAAGQIILNFTFAITATDTGAAEVAYIDQVVFTPPGGGGFGGWNSANFTPAELEDPNVSGPLADADKDGITNAVEYVLGLGPKAANSTPWQAGSQTTGQDQHPTITFSVPETFPADATLIVEEAPSLEPTATWMTLATKTGSAAWAASNGGMITQGAPSGGRIPITVRSPTAMGGLNTSGFMRLRVQVP